MGNSSSARPNDAGMTGDDIAKYYDAIARFHGAHDEKDNNGAPHDGNAGKENDCEDPSKNGASGTESDATAPENLDPSLADASSGIINSAGVTPGNEVTATLHYKKALHALGEGNKDAFNKAVSSLVKFGININHLAKATFDWIKAHPWETATIVVPLISVACTPAVLGALGFTAGGIAAGSVAAGIQAGIGSVAAGSAFAVLTSAAMGGGGAIIVLEAAWLVPTAVLGAITVWKRTRTGGGEN